jgi:hypothetical protein
MQFSDLALSRRLERAEGQACVRHAEARRRLFPESGAGWMECGGAYAIFDGVHSPVTQSFGLGLFEALTAATLDTMERFFVERGAPVLHDMSPLAGSKALELLCARNYRPVEVCNVLYCAVEPPVAEEPGEARAQLIAPEEAQLWSDINAKAWFPEHPELREFLLTRGAICAAREGCVCFIAEVAGAAQSAQDTQSAKDAQGTQNAGAAHQNKAEPGAAGVLCIHDGVALFGGSATLPEMRRRGLQAALLGCRMSYAFEHGCELAMMAAEPGSRSQRNAERRGFRVAYTRTKWKLCSP